MFLGTSVSTQNLPSFNNSEPTSWVSPTVTQELSILLPKKAPNDKFFGERNIVLLHFCAEYNGTLILNDVQGTVLTLIDSVCI